MPNKPAARLAYADPATPRPRGPRRRRTAYCVAGVVTLLALAGAAELLRPRVIKCPERGTLVKCLSNIRQIGLGMQYYAIDHGGQLPPDLETTLMTQDLGPEQFVCPSSGDQPATGSTADETRFAFRLPGRCSYVQAIGPVDIRTLTPEHVMVYERPTNHGAENGGVSVLFGDFHAEVVSGKQADHLIAETQAGHNPPRPPRDKDAR